MKEKRKSIDRDKLERLGFSQNVISSVERMDQLGFFELQPPDDLVDRTIEKCLPFLPTISTSVEKPPVMMNYGALINELSVAARASAEWGEFSDVQDWQYACLTTLEFAKATHKRPFIILDNHNVIEPAWWGHDTGFRAFWNASQVVNKIAEKSNLPRSACFVVLRPTLHDYSDNDLDTIKDMVRTGSSDVWWIPFDRAGIYQRRDLIVLGEDRVLELDVKPDSPVAAMRSFREKVEQGVARSLRDEITFLETLGKSIRVEGQLSNEAAESISTRRGIRHLMQSVISGMKEVVQP